MWTKKQFLLIQIIQIVNEKNIPLKILCTGPNGTGKTFVCKYIQKLYPKIKVSDGIVDVNADIVIVNDPSECSEYTRTFFVEYAFVPVSSDEMKCILGYSVENTADIRKTIINKYYGQLSS
jgi:Cdc6-like AAA superfamily ATPase